MVSKDDDSCINPRNSASRRRISNTCAKTFFTVMGLLLISALATQPALIGLSKVMSDRTTDEGIESKMLFNSKDQILSKEERLLLAFQEAMHNSEAVKNWRHKEEINCQNVKSKQDEDRVNQELKDLFTPSVERIYKYNLREELYHEDSNRDTTKDTPLKDLLHYHIPEEEQHKIEKCPFVFIDLGSGTGDSIGQFIDSGLDKCNTFTKSVLESHGSLRGDQSQNPGASSGIGLHFDVDTGKIRDEPGHRPGQQDEEFTAWVTGRIDHFSPLSPSNKLGPEDYCVYGVEGNPSLTSKLSRLERHINKLWPRPTRHVHFFTETVAHTTDDDERTIYLDTLHGEDSFPGSSLFYNHENIQQSKKEFDETDDYKVTSITLSSLMKKTLSAFPDEKEEQGIPLKVDKIDKSSPHPDNEPSLDFFEQRTGNHLLLNFNVEGSEFHILNELKDSGILCEFTRSGNYVDIFIDYHSPEMLGFESPNAKRYVNEVRPYFRTQCGDNLSFYERNRYFMPETPSKFTSNAVV